MNNPNRKSTIEQLAKTLDVSVSALRGYISLGVPHDPGNRRKPARFDALEVREWMAERGLTGKPGRPALTGDEALDELKRQREAEMVKYYRLRNQRTQKELVPVAEVERLGAEVFRVLSAKLLGFAAAIVPRLEGRQPHEQMAVIDEGLRGIVEQFGRDISTVADRAAEADGQALDDDDEEQPQPQPLKRKAPK